jgi:two-component system LytT family sensor kinase
MKVKKVALHIGFWVLYIAISTFIKASYKEEYLQAFILQLIQLPMSFLIVYFNYFILIPKYLLKGATIKYFSYTIITICLIGIIQRFINYEALKAFYPAYTDMGVWLFYKFLQSIVVMATPLIYLGSIFIITKVSDLQKKAKILENERLQSELKYLKSQINPHFLFNNLNNIYGLSLENSSKTSKLILKLSEFLNFSLYESSKPLIALEKEISLMNNYIELEKSRFEDRVEVNISIPDRLDKINIPPLIFVPLVENAFKHSLKNETEIATIDIQLLINEKQLQFSVWNTKPENTVVDNTKQGLGLENIKKRLDIMYVSNYSLVIKEEEYKYQIDLKIKVS